MAHGELKITKEEMEKGLAVGRTLIQEEWAHPLEKQWVNELITEGKAEATPWIYKNNFQCEMRKVVGTKK